MQSAPEQSAGGPALASPGPQASSLPCRSTRLHFDGQGRDYFRLWIVHLLLMLLTLGLYSPWAKVRKARWFAQHTRLLDDRFDFHGEPRRILVGRLLALGLLLLWTFAFDLSPTLGWWVVGLLLALGPWLFASAQRFRLGNHSWRGLRFGFAPPIASVYRVGLPALALWCLSTVVAQLGAGRDVLLASIGALLLALPALHARLKRLQHGHAWYGDQRFSLDAGLGKALYGVYAKALLLLVGGALGGMLVGAVLGAVMTLAFKHAGTVGELPMLPAMLWGACTALGMLALGGPFVATQVQRQVWQRTRLAGLRFEGRMKPWPLLRLCVVQGLAVLFTAGLYWPWAAVALARYRVQSIVLISDRPLDQWPAAAARFSAARQGAGDAAADLFGLDVGW